MKSYKRIVAFILLFTCFTIQELYSQTQLLWNTHVGELSHEYLEDAIAVEGGYVVLVCVNEKDKKERAGKLFKIDYSGKIVWQKIVNSNKSFYKGDLEKAEKEDEFYIAYSTGVKGRKLSSFITKYNADRDMLFEKELDIKEKNYTLDGLLRNKQGNIYYFFNYVNAKDGINNYGIGKLDAQGENIWLNSFNNDSDEVILDITLGKDNQICVLVDVSMERNQYRIDLFNENGKRVKSANLFDFQIEAEYLPKEIHSTANGDVILVGEIFIDSLNNDYTIPFIAEVSDILGEDFEVFEEHIFLENIERDRQINDIHIDEQGNVYLIGSIDDIYPELKEFPNENVWICKLDDKFNVIWERQIGGDDVDRGYIVIKSESGRLVLFGNTFYENQDSDSDIFIASLQQRTKRVNPKVYAVIAGVSDYSDDMESRGCRDLKYCTNDAKELYDFFRSKAGGELASDQVRLLLDEDATSQKILSTLEAIFKQAQPEDLVIFYFSGHGGKNVFMAHDNVLNHKDVSNIFNNSKALRKICMADACYSGSFNEVEKGNENDLVKLYYRKLAQTGNGLALFMSSSSSQVSIESRKLENGIFTYYYIEGLKGRADKNKDRFVTIMELYEYVKSKVSDESPIYQTPQLKGLFDHDMPIGVLED